MPAGHEKSPAAPGRERPGKVAGMAGGTGGSQGPAVGDAGARGRSANSDGPAQPMRRAIAS